VVGDSTMGQPRKRQVLMVLLRDIERSVAVET
jgi:hypothetical protein